MADVPSGSKMYCTPAITKIHVAVHLIKNLECTLYTLPTEHTLCFLYIEKYFYSYPGQYDTLPTYVLIQNDTKITEVLE